MTKGIVILLIVVAHCSNVCCQSNSKTFSGNVIDNRTNEPIVKATVVLPKYKIGTYTDAKGNYSMTIPDSISAKKIIVEFHYVGYLTKSVKVKTRKLPTEFHIKLDERTVELKTVI